MRARMIPVLLVLVAVIGCTDRASTASQTHVDLRFDKHVTITGSNEPLAGGDVNGDMRPDLLLDQADRVLVVFNEGTWRDFDARHNFAGFAIEGPTEGGEPLGSQPSPAGDVNGDGLDDVLVGAYEASNNGRELSGSAYVVFGKTSTTTVDLDDMAGTGQTGLGFRIDGAYEFDLAGNYVAGLGDVNLDGLADVAVGAPFRSATYVVFGTSATDPIDLLRFETMTHGLAGFVITTPAPDTNGEYSVAGGRDINGDGRGDVLVGVLPHEEHRGLVFVIFGKEDPLPIDARQLGDAGFRIVGAHRGDAAGMSVDGTGDFNGDGLSDIVIGSVGAGKHLEGAAALVFGKSGTADVKLSNLGARGFKMRGRQGDTAGRDVSGLGDTNGDGLADIAIGASLAGHHGRRKSGSVYVLFGRRRAKSLVLDDVRGVLGFRIDGPTQGLTVGDFIAGVGDLDDDGLADVAVGGYRLKVFIILKRPR